MRICRRFRRGGSAIAVDGREAQETVMAIVQAIIAALLRSATRLVGDDVEVVVHSSDLVISGRAPSVAHARAILSERLTFTKAYLTWSKEANDVEDGLRRVWSALRAGRPDAVSAEVIEDTLHKMGVPYEGWEVLLRELLLAKRALLRAVANDGRAARRDAA